MYGDMRLLMKNMERMLRTRSSYSGLNQSKMNRKKGSNVVFRKNAAQFLYNFIDISPVIVYLPSHPVNRSIIKVSASLTTYISIAKTSDSSVSPTAL